MKYLLVLLLGCNMQTEPKFKYLDDVCVTCGFFEGHCGFVIATGQAEFFERSYRMPNLPLGYSVKESCLSREHKD